MGDINVTIDSGDEINAQITEGGSISNTQTQEDVNVEVSGNTEIQASFNTPSINASFTTNTDLSRYVPYSGATANLNLGDYSILAGNLNIDNWDTAYGWGNHAGLYDLVGTASGLIATHELTYDHSLIATALQAETDPVFLASDVAGVTTADISNWDTAYGWGNHADAGYLTAETDPIFTSSDAFSIDAQDIINLGNLSGTNTGDQSSGDFDHNSLLNTHNLTTDIDHDSITNTHNLTTDIDHNALTNTHNLTTDIDHNALTNYSADRHFLQSEISITESQISDLQAYALNSDLTTHTGDNSIHFTQGDISITESQISDLRTYLLASNNLSDLTDVSVARTNLGLVSGGTGDIWVEKAGDTMTGNLDINASLYVQDMIDLGTGGSLVSLNTDNCEWSAGSRYNGVNWLSLNATAQTKFNQDTGTFWFYVNDAATPIGDPVTWTSIGKWNSTALYLGENNTLDGKLLFRGTGGSTGQPYITTDAFNNLTFSVGLAGASYLFPNATASTKSVRLGTTVDLYEGAADVLYLAAGDDFRIGNTDKLLFSTVGEIYNEIFGGLTIRNLSSNDDIFFYCNDNGTDKLMLTIDGSANKVMVPQFDIIGATPTITQEVQRSTGGYAFAMFNLYATNTTTSLSTNIAQIGALGNVQSGATPPSIEYLYMGCNANPAYNNATFFIYPDGEVRLPFATASGQGLLLGGDVELYRSAANELAIPDLIRIGGTTSDTDVAVSIHTAVGTALNLSDGDADSGLYAGSYQGGSNAFITGGVKWTGAAWEARAINASLYLQNGNNHTWYSDTSLTAGNIYSPTEKMRLTRNGLSLSGVAQSATAGPHFQTNITADTYPLFQLLSWNHGTLGVLFDAYYDGSFKSSYATSNYRIYKLNDNLQFDYASGVAQGGAVSWTNGIVLTTGGQIRVPTVGSGAGLVLGGDFHIYRGLANTGYIASGDDLALVDGDIYFLGGAQDIYMYDGVSVTHRMIGSSGTTMILGQNTMTGNIDIRGAGGSAAGVHFRFTNDGDLRIWQDNYGLVLGAGQDASIKYDGTDVVYNSQKVGTGDHLFTGGPIRQKGIFAEIYVADGSTAQSIPTGATYTKLTGFTTDNGSSNCTPDAANDKITITKTGLYLVSFSFSGASGTANVEFKKAIFWNGVEQNTVHTTRKYSTANDIGNDSCTGIIDVTTANTDIDLRARHDNGGSINLTPQYMVMTAVYIGET